MAVNSGNGGNDSDGMPRAPKWSIHPVGDAQASLGQASPEARPAFAPPQTELSVPLISSLDSAADTAPPSIPSAAGAEDFEDAPPISRSARALVQAGDIIAQRYEVLSILGEGGMGIVYRCRELGTGQDVALKRVIPPESRQATEYITWFYKEARALATLDHPNIVRARDFGQLADGTPYLAMDLVHGVSVHEYTNARLAFPVLWAMTDQILAALAHAHARRVIHGDLKPSNIIIEERKAAIPKIHILDFGLAWLKEDPHDERLDGEKAMEFTPHAGAGTPGYMAPEQIMHEMHHVGGATDLYALGCILYRFVSGKAPFSGDPKELLKLHAYETIPPLVPLIPVPDGVCEFIMRLLEKRPWDRFEFAQDARRAWAPFRPTASAADATVTWRFPRIAATRSLVPRTRDSSQKADNGKPGLRALRTTGLLSIRPSPFVGREDVRAKLAQITGEIVRQEGEPHRLVILLGPAGVGKSRLAEWLFETVAEEGLMVPLLARYRPIRGPLDGMIGAVTQYFNFERADRDLIERSLMQRWGVKRNDQKMRTWVAGASEWLRPRPPGDVTVGPTGIRFSIDTLDVRRQIIRYTLRRIAQERPLMFFMDDLHNAGDSTIEGLLRIHRTESDQRFLMIATVRSEDVRLGTAVAERLRHLRERFNGEVIEISPLEKETTCELLRASLPLDDEAVQEAAKRSRGFPLFALQQLHAWAHGGEMEYSGGTYRVPRTVLAVRPKTTAELWESRLAALSLKHRQAAFAVSTLGQDIRRAVIDALLHTLGIDSDEAIARLQNAEIILPRGPGRFSWPHALLQEHLYSNLSQREDAALIYRSASQALLSHPLSNTRRIVRQRVVNMLAAGDIDNAGRTFFAFLTDSWNGALQPTQTLGDLDLFENRLTGNLAAHAHRWRAESLRYLGSMEEAEKHADWARSSCNRLGDKPGLAQCLRLLGQLRQEQGRPKDALRFVSEAHVLMGELGDSLGCAMCDVIRGELEVDLGNFDSALAYATRADSYLVDNDRPLGYGQCLLLRARVEQVQGKISNSRQLTLDARSQFERAGYRLGYAQTSEALAMLEYRLGNIANAERGAQDALGLYEALKTIRGRASSERLLGMVCVDNQFLDAAEIHAGRSMRLFRELNSDSGVAEARLVLAQVALSRNEIAAARSYMAEVRDTPMQQPEPKQHYLLTKAWLSLAAGEQSQAFDALKLASTVFENRVHVGDHSPQLLARLHRLNWTIPESLDLIEDWRQEIQDTAMSLID